MDAKDAKQHLERAFKGLELLLVNWELMSARQRRLVTGGIYGDLAEARYVQLQMNDKSKCT